MNRRRLWSVGLLVLLLLAADTLAWLRLQQVLDRELALGARQAARAGWRLDAVPGRRGGWPLAATRVFAAPELSRAAPALSADGIVWSGESLTASLSLLHPGQLTLLPGGMQLVSENGAGMGRSLRFWGSRMAMRLPVGTSRLDHAGLEASALHVAFPGVRPDEVVTAGQLRGVLRWNSGARALTLTLHDVMLPGADGFRIGRRLPDAALEASLIGHTGRSGDALANRLRAWRADGGRLLVRQASLAWPGARIEASGQASLDENLQPDGGITVRVTGADILLDRWAQSGGISPSMAGAMRAVLGLIAAGRGRADGAAPGHPLELWLSLHAGLLRLGQIPLLQLPSPFPTEASGPMMPLP